MRVRMPGPKSLLRVCMPGPRSLQGVGMPGPRSLLGVGYTMGVYQGWDIPRAGIHYAIEPNCLQHLTCTISTGVYDY